MRTTDLLKKAAEQYADRVAVSGIDNSFTYKELYKTARTIGTNIANMCNIHTAVPVFLEKSPETLASYYGIAMAGCAYVPISGEQPNARVEKILEVLQADIVITDETGSKRIEELGFTGRVILIEELVKGTIDEALLNEREETSSDEDTLYVMFTSGSTGNPKGVEISHRSVIQFIGHFVDTFNLKTDDRFGNQAPFDFDVSVKDIYSAVTVGAELVLIPKEYFAIPPKLIDYICDREVTTLIWAVPALCIISAMKGFEYRVPDKLRNVMFSGQAMPVKQLIRWQDAVPGAKYVNLYGPTEITCNCMYYKIDKKFELTDKLPLGNIFQGRDVKIVDDNGNEITEKNKPGEIYVFGESLAKGYYNNPAETDKKFVTIFGQRAYKSGDMAEYGDDGVLYFGGRCDFQIKHMGHRIELEEVEASIMSIDGVESCCCTYNKEKQRMTAFYTGTKEKTDLRVELKDKLPAYMIPNKFNNLLSLPLLKNGKIDRQLLATM